MRRVGDIVGYKESANEDIKVKNKILNDSKMRKILEENNITDELLEKNIDNLYELYLFLNKVEFKDHFVKIVRNDDKIFYELCETEESLKRKKEKKLINSIKTQYIPKSVLNCDFANIYQTENKARVAIELTEICDKYLTNIATKGAYLYGQSGSGKTFLMGAVYNYLKNNGENPAIIYFPNFVKGVKKNIATNSYNELVDMISEEKILIIDDIGSENLTDFVRDEVLIPIINHRAAENLLTFFTSNLDFETLHDFLATTKNKQDDTKAFRIINRIARLTEPILLDKN